jgi:Ca2+-binding EF-hand superfamily protein
MARMIDLDGDMRITEDELYATCQSMDWDGDGYLSIEEFLEGNINLQNEIGIC